MKKRVRNEKSQHQRYVLAMAKLLYVIQYLGRYCAECKFDGFDEPWFMDLHHKNPEDKDYDVKNRVMHRTFINVKDEIDKCILLCGRCHRKLHSKSQLYNELKEEIITQLDVVAEHGGTLHHVRWFSDEEVLQMKAWAEAGWTIRQIAEAMGRTYEATKPKLRSLGIKCKREQVVKLDDGLLIRMFKQQLSLREIGSRLGTSYMTVKSRLVSLGIVDADSDLHHDAVVRENKRRGNAT